MVGGDLTVQNNTNLTTNLAGLSKVGGSLSFTNNANTVLPVLLALSYAENIHYRGYVINNLVCNGTHGTTGRSNNSSVPDIPTPGSTQPAGLSDGAWAGVGLGIGISVLGFTVAVVWLCLRARRASGVGPDGANEPSQEYKSQLDGTGIVRCEVPGEEVVCEKPGDRMHELPQPIAELQDTSRILGIEGAEKTEVDHEETMPRSARDGEAPQHTDSME
ncbi:hypothetical protein DL771_008749 [Monosporascus sp. 5C6A]|nr:hypothetical protein DL771_008749 [Monosporascus sp. 5C6A]